MPISIEHGRFNKFVQGLIFSERVEWGGSYEFLGLRPVSETKVSEKDENVLNKTLQKQSNRHKKLLRNSVFVQTVFFCAGTESVLGPLFSPLFLF